MRLRTHLKAARTTRHLTAAAVETLTGISAARVLGLETGVWLPSSSELMALSQIYIVDSPSVFMWATTELIERLVERDTTMIRTDEDLFELLDLMIRFLAERDRL
jgi:transcriptional regulator with XRE-family HTH domain